jgi:hypothetical protein
VSLTPQLSSSSSSPSSSSSSLSLSHACTKNDCCRCFSLVEGRCLSGDNNVNIIPHGHFSRSHGINANQNLKIFQVQCLKIPVYGMTASCYNPFARRHQIKIKEKSKVVK